MALNLKSLLTKIIQNILPITGGQMTGDLKTSFKSSSIIGSKIASNGTISGLLSELINVYQMGSIYLSEYNSGAMKIPSSWYNYISFKNNKLLLFDMTNNNGIYVIYSNNQIYKIDSLTPVKGNMSNGTTTYYNLNGTAGTHYYYVKVGNIVTVNFNVKCTTASNSMTTFASGLPKHNCSTIDFPLACETNGSYRPIWARINADGTISAMLGSAGKYYYGSICYLTYE